MKNPIFKSGLLNISDWHASDIATLHEIGFMVMNGLTMQRQLLQFIQKCESGEFRLFSVGEISSINKEELPNIPRIDLNKLLFESSPV